MVKGVVLEGHLILLAQSKQGSLSMGHIWGTTDGERPPGSTCEDSVMRSNALWLVEISRSSVNGGCGWGPCSPLDRREMRTG